MKKQLQSYFHFSKTERYGVVCLLGIIAVLSTVRFSMHLWLKPSRNTAKEQELRTAWAKYKAGHRSSDPGTPEIPQAATYFAFDPNMLDSQGFVRLGLQGKTIHYLLNWRRKGKVFRTASDLRPLYTLSAEEYQRLEPFIHISSLAIESGDRPVFPNKNTPLPAEIDLNTADSALLVRLNGIGPVLSHRIVERRKALGGFRSLEQLREIYPFEDSIFRAICLYLKINAGAVQKMDLNEVSLERLKNHPYIGEKMAKNIILFREGMKRFENIDQLRQVPLMNEENYRKIAPYFTIE